MTPSGIESVTFWLLAQFLNQLRHRVPPSTLYNKTRFLPRQVKLFFFYKDQSANAALGHLAVLVRNIQNTHMKRMGKVRIT
jgi:hypothetical protein